MAFEAFSMQSSVDEQPPNPGFLKKLLGLLSDAATYGLSTVIGQVVQFFLLPVYTSYLGPKEYGISAMLIIVTMLFGPVANLGMTNAIFRRFNQAPSEEAGRTVLSTGLFSVIIGSCSMFAVTVLFSGAIATSFVGDPETINLVRLCLLSATFNTISQVPSVLLRARRNVRIAAVLNLANVVISICATIVFVVGFQMGVKGLVLGTLAAEATFLILAFACTWGLFELRLDRTVWKSMLSYGLPFLPHRLQAVALAQFGQYMVREMLGLDQAGIYNLAVKFALPVGLIVNAIQEAWIPYKFQVHAQEADARPLFRSIFTYYIAGLSYLWVGVSLWGFDVVRAMTTPAFHSAAMLIPVLALLRVSQGIYFMMGTGVELSDKTGAYPLISLAGLLTVIVGAFTLVGPLGALGAALASVLCWLVMAGVVYVLARQRLDIPYDWPTLGCFALLSTVCVGGAYAVQSLPLVMRLTVYLAVSLIYPIVAFVILARSSTERKRMQLFLARLRCRNRNSTVGELAKN
jgi:O-antigen/teichoic acid export membrane protein